MDAAHDLPLPDDRTGTPERLRTLPSRLLSLTGAHADRMVTGRLAEADARKWHYAVLVVLEAYGPASQATLSRRTGVYRSDLVAVINELSARGLVERAPDPEDRRRNVITLTERGGVGLRRLDTVLDAVQDDILAPLDQPERAELTRLLGRLLDHHAGSRQQP